MIAWTVAWDGTPQSRSAAIAAACRWMDAADRRGCPKRKALDQLHDLRTDAPVSGIRPGQAYKT